MARSPCPCVGQGRIALHGALWTAGLQSRPMQRDLRTGPNVMRSEAAEMNAYCARWRRTCKSFFAWKAPGIQSTAELGSLQTKAARCLDAAHGHVEGHHLEAMSGDRACALALASWHNETLTSMQLNSFFFVLIKQTKLVIFFWLLHRPRTAGRLPFEWAAKEGVGGVS